MVEIVSYKESWPDEFAVIGAELCAGLGVLALRIDHIGSTAVPGLAAKDRIDIQVTVAGLETAVTQAMAAIGYELKRHIHDHIPPGGVADAAEWEKWLFAPPDGQRPTNLHVRVQGRANQRFPLLFRDFLRGHPTHAAAYAELKRRLAAHLADPKMYPEVKDPAVDLIYFAAEKWAAETGWQPGASDA